MPYYQYDVKTEIKLRDNQSAIDKIESEEESKFNQILSRPENKLIDLIDLIFPPRFWKKPGQICFHPTLPTKHRKLALEFIHKAIIDKKFLVDCKGEDANAEIDRLLLKGTIDVSANIGFVRLSSYAVVNYDTEGSPLIDPPNVLSSIASTRLFVEFLIESMLLPLELLNFKSVLKIFLQWNRSRLKSLPQDLKQEEGWPLINVVSMVSDLYVLRQWVSIDKHTITGFQTSLTVGGHPLRFGQEDQTNLTEHGGFNRAVGCIDSGKLPDQIVEMGNSWNAALKKIQSAMLLDRIKHTGINCVNHIDLRVDEKSFMVWAKNAGMRFPSSDKLPAEPVTRTNLLHQLIADHRKSLIDENKSIPKNESIWGSIYKAWENKKIEFIEHMTRWGDFDAHIEWQSEYSSTTKPIKMTKKSFQSHISSCYSKK